MSPFLCAVFDAMMMVTIFDAGSASGHRRSKSLFAPIYAVTISRQEMYSEKSFLTLWHICTVHVL